MIFYQRATIKLLIFIAFLLSMKNATIWYMANCGRSFLTKVIHSLLSKLRSVLLNGSAGISVTINRAINQLLKILTVVARAHDGHAECCLNWNVYDISVNWGFLKKMHAKNERHR